MALNGVTDNFLQESTSDWLGEWDRTKKHGAISCE